MSWTMISEEDDSITLKIDGFTIHIAGGTWRANHDVAQCIIQSTEAKSELARLEARANQLRDDLIDASRRMSTILDRSR